VHEYDIKGTFVVLNEVEQNYAGDVLCIPYQDNGCLKAYIIDNKGNMLKNMCLNSITGFDKKSKPIMGFYQPMVTACFIQNDDLFFSVHHRFEHIQKSFIYSWKEDKILSEIS